MTLKWIKYLLIVVLVGCSSSSVKDLIDSINPDRKPIDVSKLGINAFFNDSRFGSIDSQYADITNTLKLHNLRVLFQWNSSVQPSPSASPDFSFYDEIVNSAPNNVRLLVVLTGVPQWVYDQRNWIDGNPRTTFVENWVRDVVSRYGSNSKIAGWEIWNEPNESNNDNTLLGFPQNAANYVEMLNRAQSVSKSIAPSKLVINAATTAINQNFSETLDYNRAMIDAGAQSFVDRWNIHYYGKQFENVVVSGGVEDFLNGLTVPIWMTESGAQGVNSQLAYGEQVWPFLIDHVPSIERIYIYQYAENTPPETTYGLRNLSSNFPVSDLYVSLRDRLDSGGQIAVLHNTPYPCIPRG